MENKFLIIGGNPVKLSKCAKTLEKMLAIKVYDGDRMGGQDQERQLIEEVLKKSEWILKTQHIRMLTPSSDTAKTIILIDSPLYKSVLDCVFRLKWGQLKRVLTFYRIKRDLVLNHLNQFGIEKEIVIIRNSKELKNFLKLMQKKAVL